uniref:Uncharacterized protein n=1 Tax=Acrobeloides nanus TaxID=290746 RepID=A0A914DJW4_9BILA
MAMSWSIVGISQILEIEKSSKSLMKPL